MVLCKFNRTYRLASSLSSLRGIGMADLNVCSLFRKLDEIVIMLQSSNIDVLCLNETWLNDSIDNIDLGIPGYTFI